MSAQDRAAQARARMDQVHREMSERRALRARAGLAAHERARQNLLRQGPAAEQVAKRLNELGRRHKQAGGWATEKTERDKNYVLGFGTEDEERHEGLAYRATRPKVTTRPGGIGSIEDDEAELAPEPAPEPPAPPKPPAPPAPEAPAARQVRRPAPIDDEEDFSNQSSWMRKR
jgi:hypothetical protein